MIPEVLAILAVSATTLTTPVVAAHASNVASTPADSAASSMQDSPAPTSGGIRFAFKGQSWDQILDYFSRTTSLPIVRETEVPKGSVDYISARVHAAGSALDTQSTSANTECHVAG